MISDSDVARKFSRKATHVWFNLPAYGGRALTSSLLTLAFPDLSPRQRGVIAFDGKM